MMVEKIIGPRYTSEELQARLKFFIGIVLGLTLFGIVFVVLYSLIFVTQPMNGMSPVDNKFFELIIPIATFLTGTLSGIMLAGDDKDLRMKAIEASTKPPQPSANNMNSFRGGFSPMNSSMNSPMGGGFGGMARPMGNFGPQPGSFGQQQFAPDEFLPGQSPKFTDD